MSLRMLRSLVAAATLGLASLPAAALTLQDVIDDGGFTTASGLTFDNFSAVFAGGPLDASSYDVLIGESGFGLAGAVGGADGEVASVQIRFDVWAAEQTEIIGAMLSSNGRADGAGAQALVTETITGAGPVQILQVSGSATDSIDFAGVTHLSVTKDIVADSGGVGGSARISLVTQDFGVGESPIPEPTAALLGLLGFALVGGYLRRS